MLNKAILLCVFFFILKTNAQQCTDDGVFGVNFTSCKTYEVCKSSISYKYECSTNSLFNQRNLTCQLNFVCPDTDTCKEEGFYPDPNYVNSSYYIKCTRYANNFAVTYLDCGLNNIFVPPDILPAKEANCASSTVPPKIPSGTCEDEGTFQVYHTNCTTYMVCKKLNNSLVQYKYLCSTASYFDPWEKMCVIGYRCLEQNCVSEGALGLDVNDPTGNHYYQCVSDSTGRLLPLYLNCGTNMKFDESLATCV